MESVLAEYLLEYSEKSALLFFLAVVLLLAVLGFGLRVSLRVYGRSDLHLFFRLARLEDRPCGGRVRVFQLRRGRGRGLARPLGGIPRVLRFERDGFRIRDGDVRVPIREPGKLILLLDLDRRQRFGRSLFYHYLRLCRARGGRRGFARALAGTRAGRGQGAGDGRGHARLREKDDRRGRKRERA